MCHRALGLGKGSWGPKQLSVLRKFRMRPTLTAPRALCSVPNTVTCQRHGRIGKYLSSEPKHCTFVPMSMGSFPSQAWFWPLPQDTGRADRTGSWESGFCREHRPVLPAEHCFHSCSERRQVPRGGRTTAPAPTANTSGERALTGIKSHDF